MMDSQNDFTAVKHVFFKSRKYLIFILRTIWYLKYRVTGACVSPYAIVSPFVSLRGNISIAAGTVIEKGVRVEGDVSIGQHSRIQKYVEISGNVEIGNASTVGSYTILRTMPGGQLKIGSDVLVNVFSVIGASQQVIIKDHCIFAAFLQITDASHDIENLSELTKHAEFKSSPVVIEKNVWLGSGVVVMMGVAIGANSVIGAKALVNSNIPENAVAFGVPVRVHRVRG